MPAASGRFSNDCFSRDMLVNFTDGLHPAECHPRFRGGGSPSELFCCRRRASRDPPGHQPPDQAAGGMAGRVAVSSGCAQGAPDRGRGDPSGLGERRPCRARRHVPPHSSQCRPGDPVCRLHSLNRQPLAGAPSGGFYRQSPRYRHEGRLRQGRGKAGRRPE